MPKDRSRGQTSAVGGRDTVERLLESTIAHIDQGLSIWNGEHVLQLSNPRFGELLELPPDFLVAGRTTLLDLARHAVARGDYGSMRPEDVIEQALKHAAEAAQKRVVRRLPSGRWYQADRVILPDGGIVITLADVTELKALEAEAARARDAAVRARQQLSQAFDAMSEGFVLWDADDRLVAFNERYREDYSFAPDLLRPGVAFVEILHAAAQRGLVPQGYDAERWIAERLALHRQPREPYIVQRPDGRWTLITEQKTAEGGVVGIRTDISRLRESEAAVERTRRRLAEAIESLPQGVVIYGPDDRIVTFNSVYLERFTLVPEFVRVGISFEELSREILRRDLVRPAPADPAQWLATHIDEHRRAARSFTARRHGRWILIQESRTASGDLVVIHTDITDLKTQERDLRRSRRLLRAVIDAVPAIINVKNRNSRYVLMNRFQGQVFGVDPDDAIGRTSADFTGVDYGGRSRAMDEQVIATGEALPWAERDFIDAAGEKHIWLTAKMPLKDESARVTNVVSVALDITRLKQMERARLNLARHVAPNLVNVLADTDEPFGPPRRQAIGVLFVDMIGFTAFAADRDPAESFELLREFHARLARVVFANKGTLDKFLGDGIMATFGTPQTTGADAANALACARAMVASVARWNDERGAAGEFPIRIAIGVHWGDAFVGTIGDAQRLDFTVVGDTVNVASRLETLARDLDALIATSRTLVDQAQREGASIAGFSTRGLQTLRGRSEPLEVWTLAANASP